jgi:hypothetical protein
MTITKAEIIAELRELLIAAHLLDAAKLIRGVQRVTPGQRASWNRSVKRAKEFLEKVEGPKIETGCNCGEFGHCKIHTQKEE